MKFTRFNKKFLKSRGHLKEIQQYIFFSTAGSEVLNKHVLLKLLFNKLYNCYVISPYIIGIWMLLQ